MDLLNNLRYLYLSNNKINKIENLHRLLNLNILDLSKNNITLIENLNELNLINIDLPYNWYISNFERLYELKNLKYCNKYIISNI